MDSEQLYENLLTLIERSEARIDKTNEMVQALARTCERNIEIYDKHLTSLEEARNLAQANAANSIEMSKTLTDLLTNLRNDYQVHLTALKGELHMLKDEYRKEMEEMRRDYKDLSASYRRLAERVAGGGSRSEVKISNM